MRPGTVGNSHAQHDFVGTRCVGDHHSHGIEMIELRAHATRHDDLPGYWANGQFWEELVELNAYIVLLFAAYIFAEIYRSSTDSESGP
jgi:hypothetical protein